MGITNLPKPGIGFKATLGPGSFKRKLSNATRYGDLKNLRDNQKALVDIAKEYERTIRIRGGLTRLQKRGAWLELKKKVPKLTYQDKYEAKRIIEHLGRGAAAKAKGPIAAGKFIKASDGKSYLTEAQVKKNLKVNKQRDESGFNRNEYKTSFAGNVVSTKSIGISDINKEIGAGRIGINAGPVGFASQYKSSKLPNSPMPPKAPSIGNRPIGL